MEDCLSDDLNKFRQMEPELFNIIKQKDGFKEVILLSIREIYIYIYVATILSMNKDLTTSIE